MMSNLIKNQSTASKALLLFLILIFMCPMPATAISIKEEKKLANEFMKYINRRYELIEDPTIVGYVNGVGQKILANMPPQPFEYRFYVINEDVYNAFAIPAGHIFINSGLLAAMENEDELAGLLSHEIAHVVHRHISKRIERSKNINIATMAGMVAGIFLGIATGETDAAQALTYGSAAAGQTAMLAYSREDETQADQLGVVYMQKAGYDPRGLLLVLKKIRSKQWFGSEQIPTYMMTHPAVEQRIIWIDSWNNQQKHDARFKKAPKFKTSPIFKKINIRLVALYGEPTSAVQELKRTLEKNPQDPNLLYGYGLALARSGKRLEAISYLKKAQALSALDPFILSDLGRLYYLDGQYSEAVSILEGALSISTDNPNGLFYLGRSLMEDGQTEKAVETFNTLIQKYKNYKQAYYSLGEAYGRINNMADAHYYLGIYYFKEYRYKTARFHLTKAKRMLNDASKLETVDKIIKSIKPSKDEEES